MSESSFVRVKAILAPKIIIAGNESYEDDGVYYVIKDKLFKYILQGNIYVNTEYIYRIIAIKKVWNLILKKIDDILSELRRDQYIKDNPHYLEYIDTLEHAIITFIFLQKLENALYIKNQIRQILLKNEALAYVALFKYLKNYINSFIREATIEPKNKEKEKEEIKTILRIYKAVSKFNINRLKRSKIIAKELFMAIIDPNYADITKELETIKRYTYIHRKAKLKRKIIQLKKDLKRINKQIEYYKKLDPSNPEIQKLEKEKEEIEKELQKLAKRKEIIKKDVQNGKEKAKTKSKELENKNGH